MKVEFHNSWWEDSSSLSSFTWICVWFTTWHFCVTHYNNNNSLLKIVRKLMEYLHPNCGGFWVYRESCWLWDSYWLTMILLHNGMRFTLHCSLCVSICLSVSVCVSLSLSLFHSLSLWVYSMTMLLSWWIVFLWIETVESYELTVSFTVKPEGKQTSTM